uniref:Uncharacterized protein n=1 Tax=Timema tahoe TaxID=61484 RepID=A0A7R9NY59_9NEOP|nr:unnamed protein product [Timema tahoe]
MISSGVSTFSVTTFGISWGAKNGPASPRKLLSGLESQFFSVIMISHCPNQGTNMHRLRCTQPLTTYHHRTLRMFLFTNSTHSLEQFGVSTFSATTFGASWGAKKGPASPRKLLSRLESQLFSVIRISHCHNQGQKYVSFPKLRGFIPTFPDCTPCIVNSCFAFSCLDSALKVAMFEGPGQVGSVFTCCRERKEGRCQRNVCLGKKKDSGREIFKELLGDARLFRGLEPKAGMVSLKYVNEGELQAICDSQELIRRKECLDFPPGEREKKKVIFKLQNIDSTVNGPRVGSSMRIPNVAFKKKSVTDYTGLQSYSLQSGDYSRGNHNSLLLCQAPQQDPQNSTMSPQGSGLAWPPICTQSDKGEDKSKDDGESDVPVIIPIAIPGGPISIPPTIVLAPVMQPALTDSFKVTLMFLSSVNIDTAFSSSLVLIGILSLATPLAFQSASVSSFSTGGPLFSHERPGALAWGGGVGLPDSAQAKYFTSGFGVGAGVTVVFRTATCPEGFWPLARTVLAAPKDLYVGQPRQAEEWAPEQCRHFGGDSFFSRHPPLSWSPPQNPHLGLAWQSFHA